MNIHSNISTPNTSAIEKMPYRQAIDRVATMRALVVRIALNTSQLITPTESTDNAKLREALQAQAQVIRHTVAVLEGNEKFSDLPDELSAWMAHTAKPLHMHIRPIKRMVELTEAITAAAQNNSADTAKQLQTYIAYGQDEFFKAVSSFVDHVWIEIENGRKQQLETAMQSSARLGEALGRLDRIGKYIRSMSINASVEASHAGQAGKGLAIIAQEFKTLAEEVQQLTLSARDDIRSIEDSQ